jgi:hypothetical protein
MRPILTYLGILVLVLAVTSMCVADISEPSEQEYSAVNRKVYELAAQAERIYGLPRERLPRLTLNEMVVDYDALTRCSDWEIVVDVRLIHEDLPFVLNNLLPHEIYEEIHGKNWSRISLSLGGPGTDHYRRTL